MPNLLEIREKYPEYDDIDDRQLSERLWKKDYQDMDFNVFAEKIGYDPNKDNAKAGFNATQGLNPDQEAKNQTVAKELNVPPNVVRDNSQFYQEKVDEPDYNTLSASHPMTTKYLADPASMAVSRDDSNSLSVVEDAVDPKPDLSFGRVAGQFWSQFKSSLSAKARTAQAAYENFDTRDEEFKGRYIGFMSDAQKTLFYQEVEKKVVDEGFDRVIAEAEILGERQKKDAEFWKGVAETPALRVPEEFKESSGFVEDVSGALGGSIFDIGAQVVNPFIGLSSMFSTLYGSKYSELVNGGVDPSEAQEAAFVSAVGQSPLEFAGNIVSVGAFKKVLKPGKAGDFLLTVLGSGAAEAGEEFLQTFPDEFANFLAANPDVDTDQIIREFVKSIPDIATSEQAKQSALIGGTLGALFPIAGKTISAPFEIRNYLTEKQRAADFTALQERIGDAMDQSKTKERSPDQSERFLEIVGLGETGFISSEGAQTLFQSNPEIAQEIMLKLGIDPDTALEEVQSGHDIPVKMSSVHARLSTEERTAIIGDLKPAPGAMSQNQVDEIDLDESLAEMADRFVEATQDDAAFQGEIERIKNEATAAGVLPEQVIEFGNLVERFSERMALEGRARTETVQRINIKGQTLQDFEAEAVGPKLFQEQKDIKAVSSELKESGVDLNISEKNDIITLSSIKVSEEERKSGIGTAAMDRIVDYADRTGQIVALTPSTDFGATSVNRLKKFYKRFGFVDNKGKNKDFSTTESMIRNPKEATTLFQEAPQAQTETPEFKEFFGDSKVVDEQGEPLVVFHGGPDTIEAFDEGFAGLTTGDNIFGAFYFSNDSDVAEDYSIESMKRRFDGRDKEELIDEGLTEEEAEQVLDNIDDFAEENIKVVPAFISMQNPLIVDAEHQGLRDFEKTFNIQDAIGFIKGEQVDEIPEVVFEEASFDPDEIEDNRAEIEEKAREDFDLEEGDPIEDHMFDESAREFLQDQGVEEQFPEFDGLIIKNVIDDIGAGSNVFQDLYIATNPTQIKSATENIGTFDPADPRIFKQQKKGAIKITPEGSIITIFQGSANASTLFHETGHLFLNEMQSVIALGTASEELISDEGKIREWLGVDLEAETFTTDQQEKFARGFEAYLFEGKAPAPELESSFERFRKWLLAVYKSIKNLDVELNDDIRSVFDRMLVAEQETFRDASYNEMEMPSKRTMDALGIVSEDREFMQRLLAGAVGKAEQDLVKARNKDNRSKRKGWKEEGKKLSQERPEYQLLTRLSKGDGLQTEQMVYIYGKENIAKIPKTVPRVVRKDGEIPGAAAKKYGYDTRDEMVADLTSVIPEKQFIEEYVNRKQLENDAKFIPNDFLLNSKEYPEYLAILAKYENRGVVKVQPARAFKTFAKKIFKSYTVRKAIRSDRFIAALKKFSKTERKKAQQGKFGEASEANEKARLNYELSGLSIHQRTAVEKLIKRSGRIINSKTIKSEYKQQALRVMERFSVTKRQIVLDETRPTIGEFFTGLTSGVDIEMWEMVPTYSDVFMADTLEMDFRDLTVEQFEELTDLIKYLERRGRNVKKKVLSDGKTEIKDAVDTLIAPMISRKRKKKVFKEDSILEKLTTATRRFFATQESLPFINRRLDGFVSAGGKKGPNEEQISDRLFDADNNFINITQEYFDKLNPIADYFQKRSDDFPRRILDTGVPVPENMKRGKERFWTFERIVAVSLNMGNEQNLQRITGGYGLTETEVNSLVSILNEEDWNKVQETWNIVNSLWPQLDAVFFKINDFHQRKVQADPFTTPTGQELKGGYYPILYDRSLNTQIGEWAEKEDYMNSAEAMFPPANPKNGMLQSRAAGKVSLPVKLDLNVLFTHVNTSVRYITHAEAVNDINRIVKNETYQKSVEKVEGQALYEMIRPSLAEIARPNSIRLEHMDTIALREAQRATSYTLGLSRSVALKQPFSIFGFVNDVGDGNFANGVFWYMRGVGKVLVSPFDAYEGMRAASPFMRSRSDNVDRDLRKNISLIKPGQKSLKGVTWRDVQDAVFIFIKAMDFATVFPSWQGAYQKGMKINNGDMTKAVRYADSQIRNSQPSSQEIDLTHLQRSKKGWHRFFTLFSTFTAKFGARQRFHYNAWRNGAISHQKYLSLVSIEQVAPPIMMNLMFALMWGEEPDPEGVALDTITYQFIGVFLVREFVGAVSGIFKGFKRQPFDSPVLIGSKLAYKTINDTIQWLEDLGNDEKLDRTIAAFVELLSYGARVPIPKVIREVDQGIEQYENGDGTAINILVRNPKIRKRR